VLSIHTKYKHNRPLIDVRSFFHSQENGRKESIETRTQLLSQRQEISLVDSKEIWANADPSIVEEREEASGVNKKIQG
jgi:hypothetical protein